MKQAVHQTHLQNLPLIARGKVRDIYQIDEHHLLFVTTDRISAFDVIMPNPVPGKGEILTRISNFWFNKSAALIPNHLSELPLADVLSATDYPQLKNRCVVVKKLRPLPVEAIVRGYIIGSGWKDYQVTGTICGLALPQGLKLAEQLPQPIFTPSSKAAVGDHDINISFDDTVKLIGKELAEQVREVSIALYKMAAEYALERGIIIADTKFEFGLDENDQLVLADEVLTPDSSRFWPLDQYRIGENPVSFDKQFIRDYLETLDWNKKAPGPDIPAEIIRKTQQKYQEAYDILTHG
ncbi:MAG: phosphoribosylaminoimidazolesuccinocarboxamide synthase [Gammaproteobacteria bacterium]|nr:phosphoribosylaminoimidazolesuccinocarboxamide synthase [Gammaproteobacteria bacterium]MBL7000323.1 phosphoribosylaminoimidazolesuccinocarboxamide synthase [Gammaproteobacteria bacterium]